MARSNNNNKLKAFVRFHGSGRIISSRLIVHAFKPKVGNWKEIDAKECCNYTTTTTTTIAPTTTSTTTITPTTTTTTTGVYTYNVAQCCGGDPITLYSSSPSIIVGTVLYTNIGLTTLYNGTAYIIFLGSCPPSSYTNGTLVNASGVVTTITHSGLCD